MPLPRLRGRGRAASAGEGERSVVRVARPASTGVDPGPSFSIAPCLALTSTFGAPGGPAILSGRGGERCPSLRTRHRQAAAAWPDKTAGPTTEETTATEDRQDCLSHRQPECVARGGVRERRRPAVSLRRRQHHAATAARHDCRASCRARPCRSGAAGPVGPSGSQLYAQSDRPPAGRRDGRHRTDGQAARPTAKGSAARSRQRPERNSRLRLRVQQQGPNATP